MAAAVHAQSVCVCVVYSVRRRGTESTLPSTPIQRPFYSLYIRGERALSFSFLSFFFFSFGAILMRCTVLYNLLRPPTPPLSDESLDVDALASSSIFFPLFFDIVFASVVLD